MLRLSILMSMIFVFFGSIGTASAFMIDFDDAPPHKWITDQYSDLGITFDQVRAIENWNEEHAPKKYPGDIAAVTSLGDIHNDSAIFKFDFVLGSFGLLVDAVDRTLTLEAYDRSDNLVASSSQYIVNGDWYPMSIDLTGVSATKIVLHGDAWLFGFDNILFQPKNQLCDYLGDEDSSSKLDRDLYQFNGSKGDKITIKLKVNEDGENNGGKRAMLILKDKIKKVRFFKIDLTNLPNKITATLPATGNYTVVVAEFPRVFKRKQFQGDYCLTLEGTTGILKRLSE